MRNQSLGMELFVGITSLVLGLFLFVSRVSVSSGMGFNYGGYHISGGLIILPFFLSLIWLVVSTNTLWPKLALGLSVAIIIFSIVINTRFYFAHESLLNYLMMLAMIAVGIGLIIKAGFSDPTRR